MNYAKKELSQHYENNSFNIYFFFLSNKHHGLAIWDQPYKEYSLEFNYLRILVKHEATSSGNT